MNENEIKYVDLNGLSHFKALADNEYVAKETGKGLSTEDYTTAEKTKLASIEENAEENVIESIVINGTTATISGKTASATIQAGAIDTISVNGTPQTITNKNVDITVPTNVSDLTNDNGYQTASDVSGAISTAISGVTQFDYQIVTALPETGEKGVIYLISNSGTSPNLYDEYIWINNTFEKLGTTNIDLSGYVQYTDLAALTNAEIDTIFE